MRFLAMAASRIGVMKRPQTMSPAAFHAVSRRDQDLGAKGLPGAGGGWGGVQPAGTGAGFCSRA